MLEGYRSSRFKSSGFIASGFFLTKDVISSINVVFDLHSLELEIVTFKLSDLKLLIITHSSDIG